MNTRIADTSGQLDHRHAAEPLARRSMDNRLYFTAIGTIWRAGIQASWQPGPAHAFPCAGSRRTAFEFERGAA